jgi:hypothetical protein
MAGTIDESLVLSVLEDVRTESRQHHELLTQLHDQMRRGFDRVETRLLAIERRQLGLEERMHGFGGELELMIKSELLGRLAHFETVIEQQLSAALQEAAAPQGRREPSPPFGGEA